MPKAISLDIKKGNSNNVTISNCIHLENENSEDYKLIFTKGQAGEFVEKVIKRELDKVEMGWPINSIIWSDPHSSGTPCKPLMPKEIKGDRNKSFAEMFGLSPASTSLPQSVTVFVSSTDRPLQVSYKFSKGMPEHDSGIRIHIENERSEDYRLIFGKGKAGEFVEKIIKKRLNLVPECVIDSISCGKESYTLAEIAKNNEASFADIFGISPLSKIIINVSKPAPVVAVTPSTSEIKLKGGGNIGEIVWSDEVRKNYMGNSRVSRTKFILALRNACKIKNIVSVCAGDKKVVLDEALNATKSFYEMLGKPPLGLALTVETE